MIGVGAVAANRFTMAIAVEAAVPMSWSFPA